MTNYPIYTGLIITLLGLLSLMSRVKHLLSMLLSLELMVLGVIILLLSILTPKGADISILMIFITLAVCEGATGLATLVSLSRFSGNTLINSTGMI